MENTELSIANHVPRKGLRNVLVGVMALAVHVGCALPQNHAIPSRPSIIGGSELPDSHPLSRSTAALVDVQSVIPVPVCGATLVTEDLMVTAAHCFDGYGANHTVVSFGKDVETGVRVEIAEVRKLEGWGEPIRREEGVSHPSRDFAWIRLKQPVPEGYAPVPVWVSENPELDFAKDTPLTLVGYGRTAKNQPLSGGNRLFVEVPISKFINRQRAEEGQNLIYLQRNPGKNACIGDSGGPAFVADNQGAWFLLGVTHGKFKGISPIPDECDAEGTLYTYVGAYFDWLQETSGQMVQRN